MDLPEQILVAVSRIFVPFVVDVGEHVGCTIRGDPTDLTEDLPDADRSLKNLLNNMFID